jgi:hypothetical protein
MVVHVWILQVIVLAAVVLYLGSWRILLHRQRTQSWDALLARLIPGWEQPTAVHPSGVAGRERATVRAKLRLDARNAQTMQQIADYARRNFDGLSAALDAALDESIDNLHRDATFLRLHALASLALCTLGRPVKTLG